MRSSNYLCTEIRKAHEIIAGVLDLSFRYLIRNFRGFILPNLSKNAFICLCNFLNRYNKSSLSPYIFSFLFLGFCLQRYKNLSQRSQSRKVSSTNHTDLHESFLSSLGQSVVYCPLSVVKFQKSVSIREIRGASFANFASLREPPPCRFAKYAETL